jgi:phage tail sheath gpL-like
MSSFQTIVLETPLSADGFKSECNLAPGKLDALQSLENYLGAVSGGNQSAKLNIQVGAVKASGSFTVAAGGSANGQSGTLLNVALEAVTSGAVPADGEFNISATAATQAASMVTAIEAVLGDKLTVSRVNGVITLTAKVPGAFGNGFEIDVGDLANVTKSAFANGADGTAYEIDLL